MIEIGVAGQGPDQTYLPVIVNCAVGRPDEGAAVTNGLPVRTAKGLELELLGGAGRPVASKTWTHMVCCPSAAPIGGSKAGLRPVS